MGSRLTSPTIPACLQMETPGPRQGLVCAFWKSDDRGGGHWNTTGCWTRGTRNNSTTCQCSHLSSFAILMAHYDIEVSSPQKPTGGKPGLGETDSCMVTQPQWSHPMPPSPFPGTQQLLWLAPL